VPDAVVPPLLFVFFFFFLLVLSLLRITLIIESDERDRERKTDGSIYGRRQAGVFFVPLV
jgi:hypothetical protein